MKYRTLLKYHSWTSLLAGLFLIVLGITGSILIFKPEIEAALWKKYIHVEDSEDLNIDSGIKSIQETYPDWDILASFILNLMKRLFIIYVVQPEDCMFLFNLAPEK